jgi:hypothetical protein
VDRSRIERAAKMRQVEKVTTRREFGFGEVEGYRLRGFETSTLVRDTASRVDSVGAGIRAVAAG